MSRPRIGITCDINQREFPDEPRMRDRHYLMDAYIQAVLKSGGVPLLLPAVTEEADALAFLDGIDALIISGGGHDIRPETYGEKRLPHCGPLNPKREEFELAVCRGALSCDMPILGICGGMQVINVATGGTLVQDISAEVRGALPHRPGRGATYTFHPIEILPSFLEETLGGGPHLVNSHHHQSVKEVGPGMRVTARSADGVIEAIECASCRFVMGVQWHPESMSAYGLGDSVSAEHLFARLLDEARDYALEAGAYQSESL
ncbi:MAG: gamma-glutamyl-gamma-aminobutyrate hydrolase family protein [Candidatus Tectomicrobia bacterium]|uniref:Gamma-glutamyl-gamma-aminobutyrate hydrolase family protein n=1 Tax=Tectimicrobiota bacterium TaxID=2528274 RepID=A0A932HZD8_UNCTE|nr:gamma-glutamyl-gamma-aminobutyrate hydrolase family protein [Candidatus Tectomicrobia bacterium]